MLMNYRELSQMYQGLGPHRTCEMITEALELGRRGEPGGLVGSDFSIRELAEAVVPDGREWVQSLDPRRGTTVLEAGSGVDSTAFSNITGQLLINELMGMYQSEEFVVTPMFKTKPTRLDGEKIPGIAPPSLGGVGSDAYVVHEGKEYPRIGFGEDWITTPAGKKRGHIIPVTKETIFFDLTGRILENAGKVGTLLGVDKEKRCIDVLTGLVNNYSWKDVSYNTYQSSTPWVNLLAGSAYDLVDWTDIDAIEQLWAEMLDPNTGEPIILQGTKILACPARGHALKRILTATEIRYTASSAETQVISANPISGYTGMTSRLLYHALKTRNGLTADQAKATYFALADGAFSYWEHWPITVVQAPTNSQDEFDRDVVAQYKASERGVAGVSDPRLAIRVSGYG